MTARTLANTLSAPAARGRNAFLSTLLDQLSVYRQRRRLAELPAHMLDDLGVTAEQARQEAGRPIWDAPRQWRR